MPEGIIYFSFSPSDRRAPADHVSQRVAELAAGQETIHISCKHFVRETMGVLIQQVNAEDWNSFVYLEPAIQSQASTQH